MVIIKLAALRKSLGEMAFALRRPPTLSALYIPNRQCIFTLCLTQDDDDDGLSK